MVLLSLFSVLHLLGQVSPGTSNPGNAPAQVTQAPAVNAVLDRIIQRENELGANLRKFTPLVETYVQYLQPDGELGFVPKNDRYFLGQLNLSDKVREKTFADAQHKGAFKGTLDSLTGFFSLLGVKLDRRGFLYSALVDDGNFNAQNYDFEYIHREFLGEVRCLVFNVVPSKRGRGVRFLGRIWVEDQDYSIVRFNGVRTPSTATNRYLHFDSWRAQAAPGMWLPAMVYVEESELKFGMVHAVHLKGQTRFWGYQPTHGMRTDELTNITVEDATENVKDQTQAPGDMSPIQATRAWQQQAGDTVLEKLQRAQLLAPPGEVDKVLETVVKNLIITNHLDTLTDVHCRVLLTTPLESFTAGNTIVVSRGLLDVLPDEASLAAVLAHELAHIALGHRIDEQYAFADRAFFPDQEVFRRLAVAHTNAEEEAADQKALEYLKNSPYADKMPSVGLFLKTVSLRSATLPNLINPHLGNRFAMRDGVTRMNELAAAAPQLDMRKIEQVTALPIGGRINVDPWDGSVQLMKANPIAPLSAREKMPLEITPLSPYLTRVKVEASAQASKSAPAPEAPAGVKVEANTERETPAR